MTTGNRAPALLLSTQRWVAGTLALGLLMSGLATYSHQRSNRESAEAQLRLNADRIAATVVQRIELFQYGLRGARGAVVSSLNAGALSREIFRRYSSTRDVKTEFPGSRGFGFIRRVSRETEEQFLKMARADGAPDFRIRELEAHEGERYVIQYIEPVAQNAEAIGLDIASEKNRRKAAETALLTGHPALTGPITLVQAEGQKLQSFLLLMPIYDISPAPETVAQRSQHGIGWSYTPLVTNEVLDPINVDLDRFRLRLTDVTPDDVKTVFYDTHANQPAPTSWIPIERVVFGRHWLIEFSALPLFYASRDDVSPQTVFLISVVATLLATTLAAALHINKQGKLSTSAYQARMATIIDSSSDAIIGESLDGTITSWNRAAERLFGYPAELVIGQPLATFLIPPAREKEDADILRRTAAGETVPPFDTQRLHRDGTLIDVSITANPVREPDGTISGAAKLLRDIRLRLNEERRLREFSTKLEREVSIRTDELKRSNALLRDVLEAASELSIIMTNREGIIRIFNRGAEQMLGYNADELVDKQTPAVIHLPDEVKARAEELTTELGIPVSGFKTFIVKAEREGSEERRWTYVRKDGSKLQVSLLVTTVRYDDGTLRGYLGIAKDITEDLHNAEDLEKARIAAESANIAKSRFLATMSHELRTPLNGILGMAQMLQQPDLEINTQVKYVDTILASGRNLMTLLNDILDFSKIEAGKIELEKASFEPARIAAEMESLFAVAAAQKGLSLKATWNGDATARFVGDPFRLRQMLTNLVSNAIKFTTEGSISVEITPTTRGLDHADLEFAVRDTGIGLSPEGRENLFRPFAQAESSTTRKFGGTGLGLSIVRSLAVMMGGSAGVNSELGKGSLFWFRIPVRTARRGADGHTPNMATHSAATPGAKADITFAPLTGRVLVAEDVMTNQLVIEAMMSRFKLAPHIVENGKLAAEAIESGGRYDMILMDVQMPVMDGYDATRAIRAFEQANNLPRTPIVALTAAAYEEDRKAASAAGMDDFLTKPLEIGKLHAMLTQWMKHKAA